MVCTDPVLVHQLGYQPDQALLCLRSEIPLIRVAAGFLHGCVRIADAALDTDAVVVRADPVEGVSAGSLQAATAMPDNRSPGISSFVHRSVTLDVVVAAKPSAIQIRIIGVRHPEVVDHDELDLIPAAACGYLGQVRFGDVDDLPVRDRLHRFHTL